MSTLPDHQIDRTEFRTAYGWQSLGPVTGYSLEKHGLIVESGDAKVLISPERHGTIRVRLAPSGQFGRDHSWALVSDGSDSQTWRVEEDDDAICLVTENLRVHIQREPCRLSFHDSEGEYLAGDDPNKGMAWDGDEVRCWKKLSGHDHFFGLGERGCPLDKRGTVLVNWNHDAAEHDPWTDPLYQSHPFVLVLNQGRAHGLFFDNTYRATFDLGKTSTRTYSFGAEGGEMNYYFIPGPTPKDVVRRYAKLVGATPLPPRWSLGYQQCRWSYESARRVRGIAKRLRENRIPCDTIYLDIDYMDGFRCFTWHPKQYAKPDRLMKDLAKRGFKSVVIVDPGIKTEPGYSIYDEGIAGDHFCYDGSGKHYVGKVWPGETVFPDFTRPATRSWWGTLYKGLLEDGVTGIWNDMNEPADFTFSHGTVPLTLRHDNDGVPTDHREAHNAYGMQMARATFDGLQKLRPNVRPFVLTRAGYSGVQRYAAIWTGDNLSSWEHLRMSIPMLLNMSLSGIAFCGADIGGFRGYPSAELYTRWLQLGIFYPLCRTHTAGGREQDPTAFGKKHLGINRRAIELRYRLMPYLYTELRETAETGLPLLRPLLLDYPDHPNVHRCEHEFLFGRQLLVAPVVHEGAETRKIRLPAGEWYDFEDATPCQGEEDIEVPVKLKTIPMFARAGAVIPMREVAQHVDEKPLKELILMVFPGSGQGSFYNDDGLSYDYRSGDFTFEEYDVTTTKGVTTFQTSSRSGTEDFAPVTYLLVFKGIQKAPKTVTLAGEPISRKKEKPAFSKNAAVWWFDKAEKVVSVRVPRAKLTGSLTLSRT
ncbi:MAG: DUF4968 domain-containing protein [Phycisphaerales bacterium]|nr:DUF4968 domain-containing protein [Phycisphaerales bacterium]